MAKTLTTYKKIKTIRTILKTLCGNLKTTLCKLPSNSYQTQGSTVLSVVDKNIEAVFQSAENNLVDAHRAANALGGQKTNPKASKLKFEIIKYSGNKGIKVVSDEAYSNISQIGAYVAEMEDLVKEIDTCYKEIDSWNVTEQYVSTLTVVDILFPIYSVNKLSLINTIKGIGTTNLKQAKKDVKKLATYFKKLQTTLSSSVDSFMQCESCVKAKTYDDILATTSQITETSGNSTSEITAKIKELEEKQKTYVLLYGHECPEIAEEIARLKNLFIGKCVEDAIKNDLGNGGKKYKDWFYSKYGGLNPNGDFAWCDRFVSWLLGQMGFKLSKGGCSAQLKAFKDKNGYYTASQRQPQTGDVVFFDWDNNGKPNHVGIIHIDDKGEVCVIHGNFGGKVCYNKISDVMKWNGGSIMGYGDPLCLT